jgi:hypothetical protein
MSIGKVKTLARESITGRTRMSPEPKAKDMLFFSMHKQTLRRGAPQNDINELSAPE